MGTIFYLTKYQIPISHSLLLTSLCSSIQLFDHYPHRRLPVTYQNAVSRVIIFLALKMTSHSSPLSLLKLMLVHYANSSSFCLSKVVQGSNFVKVGETESSIIN